ncbi:MAG TPA: ABC transporter permease [Firmicutes bacterium]|nr:ABC transporter permease [Bacillota bacterium]
MSENQTCDLKKDACLVKRSYDYKVFLAPVVISILLFLIGQFINPGFASINNIGNILAIASVLCVGAAGQTLVIISGGDGIELSIGAMMSMGAVVGSGVMGGLNGNIPLAIVVILAIGAIFGFISSTGIWWIGIPPLVMTLAMSSVIDGFTMAISQGRPFGSAAPFILDVGGNRLFGPIRWLLVAAIIVVVIFELVLRKTKYGNALFLTGNNRTAARISGIKVSKIVISTYVLAGMMGALAGMFLLSSVGTAQMQMGTDYTMLSVAAVVLGGTQLSGGKGTYIGTALGAVVLVALTNVLISIGMAPGVRSWITGIVLVLILLVYSRQPKLRQ